MLDSYKRELLTVAAADGSGRKENEAKWGQRDIVEKSQRSGKCVP